jgi:hypothetical protein
MKTTVIYRIRFLLPMLCLWVYFNPQNAYGREPRKWIVDQHHPGAGDGGSGSYTKPFLTISAAAAKVEPGDTVLVFEGVYRERVSPAQGGTEALPIIFMAVPGEEVFLRGSEVFPNSWIPVSGKPDVYRALIPVDIMGLKAYGGLADTSLYGDFNPYLLNFNRSVRARPHSQVVGAKKEALGQARQRLATADPEDSRETGRLQNQVKRLQGELDLLVGENPSYLTTLGQIFLEGHPMTEVETMRDLYCIPGTWIVSPEGDSIYLHPPAGRAPAESFIEISVRHTVFSPLKRELGYIHVKGFIIEHGANHWPTWGRGGWLQVGLINCRSGNHWVIEDNIVRYAKGLGIDCGSEGGGANTEFAGRDEEQRTRERQSRESDTGEGKFQQRRSVEGIKTGYHLIRNNWIINNGHCGIAGIRHVGTQVIGNVIEKNNRTGYTSPWWEFGGIKFHGFYNGVIEGNLIRDNDCHGIWIDNQWRGSRITRNVIVNNLWSGINVELGRGPVLIDNNIIAYTRQGDGIYGHDLADVEIIHNLIYGNANFGLWFAFCTPRVRPENGCWDIKAFNNMILGNKAGAIAYPMPWVAGGNNLSDGNLFMGGGQQLDEGTGPFPPLFQFTNSAHMGKMQQWLDFEAMTVERTAAEYRHCLDSLDIPQPDRIGMDIWKKCFFVPFDHWKKILGNDEHSAVISTIKDGLQSRVVSWDFRLDSTLYEPICRPWPEVKRDFYGNPIPSENALPGPFQDAGPRLEHKLLWPVAGIRTTWMLE